MKKLVANKIILVVILSNILTLFGIMFILNYYNKENSKKNIYNLLGIFETEIRNNNIDTVGGFRKLAEINNTDNSIRLSVIKENGDIIADTFSKDLDKSPLNNHLDRKEVAMSLSNFGVNYSVRISSTHEVNFMYGAKRIQTRMGYVILRIAMPLDSVNRYFIAFFIFGILVVALIIIIIFSVMPFITNELLKPFGIIRNNLRSILLGDFEIKRKLTKFDEINIVFDEINTLAEKLDETIKENMLEKEKTNYVLDNINHGLIALNKEAEIVFINRFALTLFGFVNGKPSRLIEIIRDESLIEKIEHSMSDKGYSTFDIFLDNASKYIEVSIIPIFGNNEMLALIKLSDVSDFRKLAKEKYDLFINASHKLSTPLTSILGYSELLIKNKGEENNFIVRINDEANKMKLLIDDMLKLSRYEDKASDDIEEKIEMKKLIENIAEGYELRIKEKGINISLRLEDNLYIFANKEKISEAISNLIDNSIKYTRYYGMIEFLLYKKNKNIVFVIKDNGIGIPKKYINRVFERFFRVEEGIAKTVGGTGLGLTIVKHICSSYGAELSVRSKEHVGTEITIKFAEA